jgi:nucleotide-binding universal stress UspA family protein
MMAEIKRITFATDFSPASLAAFPHALRIAKATGAELTILHITLSPSALFMDGSYVPQQIWDDLYARMRAETNAGMDPLIKQAVDAGVRAAVSIVEGAVPADDIVKAAAATKADLLVLGTHGRTGVARFFLGSVAARVVATAPCPVLTVRPPDAAKA